MLNGYDKNWIRRVTVALAFAMSAAVASGASIIVDNKDSGFTILSGSWSTGSLASSTPWPTDGSGDYRFASTVTGAATAEVEWRPNLSFTGTYNVYIWYGQGTNRANNSPFTVDHANGSTTIPINQQANGGQWVLLGQYTFNAGTSGRVRLNNSAQSGKVVIADAVQFEEVAPATCNLNMAASPSSAGTTSPAVGGPYTKTINEVVSITATPAAGYAFDHWDVSAGSAVVSPTSPSTMVTMDQSKTVTAVFVSTAPCTLTMVVTPIGAGTTTPAVGGPYTQTVNQIVNISATANAGFAFDHWSVTAGAATASTTATATTVKMDQAKTVIAVFKSTAPSTGEFRAFWAVVFQQGYKSAAQIDTMVAAAVAGHYNVILVQMLAYQDAGTSSHGAYWNSSIVPKATDISPASFDPLAYLCTQAHANGIEVHAMSVPFRMCTTWPPNSNTLLANHPEWFSVEQADMGSITPVPLSNGIIVLDPGNPDAQEYLLSIMREWLTNYPIDGVHWDLEYVATGYYPTNVNTPNSTLARFKQITGYVGTPATTYGPWQDFRRRVNTEIVRRAHAEIMGFCTPTRQIRQSASLIAYGNIESTFSASEAYAEFSDWELWTRLGYLDTAIPMNYDRDHNASQYQYFRNAIPQEMIWANNRELVPGVAIYLNYFQGSLDQINYCRSQGTVGTASYDYWYTTTDGTNTLHDTTWYPYITSNAFTSSVPVPTMRWRSPATATEGTLWGRVKDAASGLYIDNATVQVGTVAPVQTDGNGYYVVAIANATSAGTTYPVTASKTGYPTVTYGSVQVVAGTVRRQDIQLENCMTPPSIATGSQPTPQVVCPGSPATFTVAATGCGGPFTYAWQKNTSNLSNGGHYSGVTTDTLAVSNTSAGELGDYRCVVTSTGGSTNSSVAALTFKPVIAADFNSDCSVDQADAGVFLACVSGPDIPYNPVSLPAGCGLIPDAQSRIAADFDHDGDVDQTDFGKFQRCLRGTGVAVDINCAN